MCLTAWPTGCDKAETACDWRKMVSHRVGWAGRPRERSLGCKQCGAEVRGQLNQRMAQSGPQELEGDDETGPALSEGDGAPLTRAFMEQLLREDFAMLKQDMASDIKDLKKDVIDLGHSAIGVALISDHSPLTLSLTLSAHKPGRRQWRLNTRLLAYEDTLTEIKDTVSHFLAENDTPDTSIVTFWETLKVVVRGQFIAIAGRQNALRRDKRQQLEDDIRALEETHGQSGSLAVRRQLAVQRKQLRALDEGKAEYALLRTK
ncbi:hypothetical protein NDU88_000575 [Pleurodeles waltl]|uniref:Uncharacterized protein n=1 Tax=Pleurodeles waltl TaxID=8319 RepID=A0AAV7TFG8_PLEWA|nr:hypothetical protein NDU88_000575 [Pleurodeles waltl]